MTTVSVLTGYGELAIDLSTELFTWAANKAHDYTAQALQMGLGPFLDAARHMLSARDNIPLLLERRDQVLRRAEDQLSQNLGVEARHIGYWDGSMPGQPAKRDGGEEVEYPVFGFHRDQQDFHVAFMGRHPDTNHTIVKLGHGPGPQTAHNKRRLQGRAAKYNAQVFDRGGLDGIGKLGNLETGAPYMNPGNPDDTKWLYDQLMCSMEVDGMGGDHPGLWWQIYDSVGVGTLAAGAIAAFGPDAPSIITWMNIEGQLDTYDECMDHDEI